MRNHFVRTLLTLVATCAFAATASAALIGGSMISPSTSMPSSGAGFTIDQIADGITADNSPFNGFAAIPGMVGTIHLDLVTTADLASFVLWNDINVLGEGISDFRLDFFDASNVLISSSPAYVGPYGQVAPQTYTFPGPVLGVKRVDLVVQTLNPSPCCGLRLEIREVAFNSAPTTSTPTSTWGGIKSLYR